MKICLIGSSGHWSYPLEALPVNGPDKIVGIAPGSRAESVDGAAEHCRKAGQALRLFADYRKMLDSLKPDVVSIACRFNYHAKIAVQALMRGSHVFIEKPVSITVRGLEQVKQAHAGSGKKLAAMLALRYDPVFRAAFQAVRSGAIGEVRLLNAQKSYKLGARPDFYKSRRTYGGTIPWVGSHAIDLIAWFADFPFQAVFASHSTLGNAGHGELEASALCLFTMENGLTASASMDYFRPATAPSHGDDRIRVAGTEGVIEVREGRALLINKEKDGVQELNKAEPRHFFQDFLSEIKGEGECLVSAQDSFNMTEACLLAREAADKNRLVRFPLQRSAASRLLTASEPD